MLSAIPATTTRVNENTAEHVNQSIEDETNSRVRRFAVLGRAAIDRRLAELDREWDIERVLEANAASVAFVGTMLGARDRRWLVLPAAVGVFLFQHAVQGWCPPIIWFRRMGVRTATEIDHERYALKALRGDFRHVAPDSPSDALAAARA
jgi:hypothetical protein